MNYRISIFTIIFIVTANVFAASANVAGLPEITNASSVAKISSNQTQNSSNQLSAADVTRVLGWTRSCDDSNLCGGHYLETSNVVNVQNPKAFGDSPMDITATKPAFFTQHAASVVQGDVLLSQPGREITADQAIFFRDNKTGKINNAILTGHVNFREYGKLLVADRSDLDFANKIYTSNQGVYSFLTETSNVDFAKTKGFVDVWGRAKYAIRDATGVLKLKRATYSTCPPDSTTWHLWSNRLTLDRNTGRGEATNAFIFLKKVPIFYTPYINFPIDDRRKSGFLIPSAGYSKNSGYSIDLPYYFNLAPNYDATLAADIFTNRGALLDGSFRYLTPTSGGKISVDYIPYDKAFIKFRDSTIAANGTGSSALQALQESSSSRKFLSSQNKANFNDHWQGLLDVNYASDDYFMQDFGFIISNTAFDRDQLLNRADISYADDSWNFLGRLQVFQTLHPVTQNNAQDQYKKLPQLNLSGDFPAGFGGADYRLESEIVNFMHRDDFYGSTSAPVVGGARFNMMPSISMPLNWPGGYTSPRIQLQATGYSVHDQKNPNANTITRLYPLISIDNGVIFKRDINFFQKEYTQTLEPRLFYLFVPEINQNDVPVFDTYLPPFDFDQVFRANRFGGIDRVGDANQIAVAITTRFLDEYGQEKASAGLGQVVVVHKHRVTITGNSDPDPLIVDNNIDPLRNEYLSPLVGKLQYFVNPKINATINMAWDPNYHRLNTADVSLQYINRADRVVSFWYKYALHADQKLQGVPVNLSRVGFSVGWKIWQHWNIVGNLNYNTSYHRAQDYRYGLEYNSCCWAARMMRSSNYIGPSAIDGKKNYDSRWYVQVVLKGFGSVEHDNFGEFLEGLQDKYINSKDKGP